VCDAAHELILEAPGGADSNGASISSKTLRGLKPSEVQKDAGAAVRGSRPLGGRLQRGLSLQQSSEKGKRWGVILG